MGDRTPSAMARAALDWAAAGIAVFPCAEDDKRPLVKHGVHAATTDADTVRDWWGRFPGALIGMACGAGSADVIDLDVDKATGAPTGERTIADRYPDALDAAVVVRTPSGGRHLYVACSGRLRNRVKRRDAARDPVPGVDVRTGGGYVIVPPSTGYVFERGGRADIGPDLPGAPDALLDALARDAGPAPGGDALSSVKPRHGDSIEAAAALIDRLGPARADDYEDWLRVGMALHHEFGGSADALDLWDDWSSRSAAYRSREDLEYRWSRFGRGSGAPTTLGSLKALAREDDPAGGAMTYTAWRDGWAYVEVLDSYFRLSSGARLTPRAWATTNARFADWAEGARGAPKEVPWTATWTRDARATRCERLTMRPGQGPVTDAGDYNLWREGPAAQLAAAGDAGGRGAVLYRRLIEHLTRGRTDMADTLTDWMAVGLFDPGRRMQWAPLMISAHKGLGKGMLCRALSRLYGSDMSQVVDKLGQLSGRFAGAYGGKMFVSVAETVDPDQYKSRFTAVEALKPLITEPEIAVEYKGKDIAKVDNYTRYMFASNHLDGLRMDDDERRFFVIDMADTDPLPDAFYQELGALIESDEGLADIAALLHRRRGAVIPPRAPRGDMDAVQGAFNPDWVKDLGERFGDTPVAIAGAEVRAYARRETGKEMSAAAVKRALLDAGWQDGYRRFRGGAKTRYLSNAPHHADIQVLTALDGEIFEKSI